MTTLTILTEAVADGLRGGLKTIEGLKRYSGAGFELEAAAMKTPIVVGDVPLLAMAAGQGEHAASTDFENAKKVYGWLGPLDETSASDTRLWITLTHREFFKYVQWRWPTSFDKLENPEKMARTARDITAHWFFRGGGLGAMRRNGIARLWWAAHLTHRPWTHDPELLPLKVDDEYFYTGILLKNQDVYQGLIEREFAVNRRVLTAVLAVIGRNEQERCNSKFVTALLLELNLLAKWRELTAVPVEALVEQLDGVMVTLHSRQSEGSGSGRQQAKE